MILFLQLPENEKIEIINQMHDDTKLPQVIIEKDIWVTAVLRALFSLPYAQSLSFKGGTSLSKCWNLIERFSEDVDIAINREFFGFFGDTFTIKQISKNLRKSTCKFIRNNLQFDLANQLEANKIPANLFSVKMNITTVTTIDPEKVFVEKPFEINAVVPERTFLEKVCLLHEEFSKQDSESIQVERMSRHLYDLAKMADTPIVENALKNKDLFQSIVAHRRMFIAMKNFNYDTLAPATLNIIPPKSVIAKWEDDYNKMQTMIYGNLLSFNEIIDKITLLNKKLTKLK